MLDFQISISKYIKTLTFFICAVLCVTNTATAESLEDKISRNFNSLFNSDEKTSKNEFLKKHRRKVDPGIFDNKPSNATSSIGTIRIIRDKRTEKFLQKIALRLLQHWHGHLPKRIGIFIKSGDGVGGIALPSGDILINIGTFNRIQSEDELAALIAHEMGHILLKHFKDNKDIRTVGKAANIAGAIYMTQSAIRHHKRNPKRVNKDSIKAVLVREGLKVITEEYLLYSFSRKEEYEADRFSGENLYYARYDHISLKSVLEDIRSAQIASEHQKKHVKSELKIENFDDLITGAIGELFGIIKSHLNRTHPKVEERINKYSQHMLNHFGQDVPVARSKKALKALITSGRLSNILKMHQSLRAALYFANNGNIDASQDALRGAIEYKESSHPDVRLLIYDILLSANKKRSAFLYLRGADRSKRGSISFYATLAREYTERRSLQNLESHYDNARQMLLEPSMIYVSQIHSYRKLGQLGRMRTVLSECKRTGNEQLIKACKNVSQGRCPDDDYRNTGSDLLDSFRKLTDGADRFLPESRREKTKDTGC